MGVIGRVHGARKSIAVVRRKPLMKLGDYVPVDALVNPNQALASLIMRHVRYPSSSGALSIIEKIDAEMLEVTLREESRIIGKRIKDLGLPKGILLALARRGEDVFVPMGDTVLQSGDQIVLFASSEQMPKALEILGVK
jgi:trk system potassium uptake protein TrkA